MTAQTPIGLMGQTILPQGATNSVGQFRRVNNRVLEIQITQSAVPSAMISAWPVRRRVMGKILPVISRFVLEHIQNLDEVLCDVESAGIIMSGEVPVLHAIAAGGTRDKAENEKIVNWPSFRNPKQ